MPVCVRFSAQSALQMLLMGLVHIVYLRGALLFDVQKKIALVSL